MGTYWNKLKITCPFCGYKWESEDSREFSEEDDCFMYTSGTIAKFSCPNCKNLIDNTDDMYAEKRIEICEFDEYLKFLRRQLPEVLLEAYSAPDRTCYRNGEVTTVEWYYRFAKRLSLQFPDDRELQSYYHLIMNVRLYGTRYLTDCRLYPGVSVFSSDLIHFPSCLCRAHLPETVKEIAPHAFENCKRLSRVFLPSGIRVIGASAFKGCISLTKIHSPEQLEVIDDMAFMNSYLYDFYFPNGLKKIGERAFANTKLSRIYIPDTVEHIGELAFSGCAQLRQVTLPKRFTRYAGFFDGEEQLQNIQINFE